MAKVNLTKRLIDSLKGDNPRGIIFFDIQVPGFGIKVYASGKKTFILRYGTRDHRKEKKIGEYGSLTLEDARKEAWQLRAVAIAGGDPAREEEEEELTDLTFSEWVDRYLEYVKSRKKHPREDIRYLGSAVELWGDRQLGDIKTDEIEEEVLRIAKSGKQATANRWLASLRACLQRAWRLDKIVSNPAMKVKGLPEPEPRTRVLSDEEFDRLVKAIDTLPDVHTRAAFVVLLETGARLSEVLHAKWEHIDFVNASWRVPSTKSGKPQTIPLLPDVLAMLKELPRDSVHVIAGKIKDQPRNDLKRPWKTLLEAAGITGVTIHDLRRTFGLQVSRTSGLHVASKLLRHSDIRITERHYAPLDIEEQRRALEKRKGR